MKLNRKLFSISAAAGLASASFNAAAQPAQSGQSARTLSFDNVHTGEKLTVTYWKNGSYDQGALSNVSQFMRDFRRNEVQTVNPQLLDALYDIQTNIIQKYPTVNPVFEVISGFRSEETTDALRAQGQAVARKTSQHQLGNAMDVRISGVPLTELRDTAWCLQQGGVGYYPETHNNFVHVDVGRVRFWGDTSPKWKCMR